VTSYFWALNFLDSLDTFDDEFGTNMIIFGTTPASDANMTYISQTGQYVDKCMLDVFLDVCWQDYVEEFGENSKKKVVHDICTISWSFSKNGSCQGVEHRRSPRTLCI